jgi:hypothetical protein
VSKWCRSDTGAATGAACGEGNIKKQDPFAIERSSVVIRDWNLVINVVTSNFLE